MGYSVGQVAELAGVTIRTLHHYGEIGLLVPDGRDSSGYRRYREDDLQRLRHILFYRELGFPLADIAVLLDDPGVDTGAHLRRQRALLTTRISRLGDMVAAIDKEMEARVMGIDLTPAERFEIFGPDYSDDYAAQAQQRWGDTSAWTQSQQRTSRFTRQDWTAIKQSGDELNRRLADAMIGGEPPDGTRAMELAQQHRAAIEQFYDCSAELHRGLGDLFVTDDRFRATYEAVAPGLAQWLRDAIHANADRQAPG